MFMKKKFSLHLESVRPECFLSSKNVSKDVKKNRSKKLIYMNNPSIHFPTLHFGKHSGRTDWGKIFILILISMSSLLSAFSYDSVIYTAQNGDIKTADQQMRSIVVNSPDDSDVLYDAGVLASQLQNHSQAAAYFNRSAQCAADHNKDLCFRAHYNAGNAYVDTKDLKSALEHYDAALVLDPDNEYARHNRDRVAEMLNQQEQQKNNDQQDKQDQKDDKDQQNKDKQNQNNQSHDKSDQQNNDNDQEDDQNQEGDQEQNNDSPKDGSDQKSKGKQGKGSDQDSKREQGAEQGDTDQDQQDSANDKKRNGEQEFDKQSEGAQNEREKQQGQQHEKAPQEQDKTKSPTSIPSEGKQEQDVSADASAASEDVSDEALAKSDALASLDPWLQGILNDQELHDKAVNKKLMEARIRQHGGKNGQNCW